VSLHLVLPLPPNRANDRSHWRKVHAQKSAYYAAAGIFLYQQAGPRQTRTPKRVTLCARLYVKNLNDPDNLVSRLKWPIDLLVLHGLLYEDRGAWLDLQMPTQEIDRKRPRVELWLEPAA
jgi:hypothetical protein